MNFQDVILSSEIFGGILTDWESSRLAQKFEKSWESFNSLETTLKFPLETYLSFCNSSNQIVFASFGRGVKSEVLRK